jgi:hypothetical protein
MERTVKQNSFESLVAVAVVNVKFTASVDNVEMATSVVELFDVAAPESESLPTADSASTPLACGLQA